MRNRLADRQVTKYGAANEKEPPMRLELMTCAFRKRSVSLVSIP